MRARHLVAVLFAAAATVTTLSAAAKPDLTSARKRVDLSASITGRTLVQPSDLCEWDASISGGTAPYTTQWQVNNQPGGWTQPTQYGVDWMWYTNGLSSGQYFEVWLDVWDSASGHVQVYKHVNVNNLTTKCGLQ